MKGGSRNLAAVAVVLAVGLPSDATAALTYDDVRTGLAEQMAASAEQLRDGHRYPAMMALNRALHLAKFGAYGQGMPQVLATFRTNYAAIKRARHAVQMGNPAVAWQVLEVAARTLQREHFSDEYRGVATRQQIERAEGRTVLDPQGFELGEAHGYLDCAGRLAFLRITTASVLGIGIDPAVVPIRDVLIGRDFIIAANPRRGDAHACPQT